MMTAQDDDRESQSETLERLPPALGNLTGVMNSVQGLQQRLGDFSADDVGKATEKAKTLIQRLSDLQRKLNGFAKIQKSLLVARNEMNQLATEKPDISELSGESAPDRATRRANDNNLFHVARIAATLKADTNLAAAQEYLSNNELNVVNTRSNGSHQNQPKVDSALLKELATPGEHFQLSGNLLDESGPAGDVSNQPDQNLPQETMQLHERPSQEKLGAEASDNWTTRSVGEPQATTETRSEMLSSFEDNEPTNDPNEAVSLNGSIGDFSAKSLVPVNADIDERLLADLIKNYGEFMSAPGLPATRDPAKAPTKKSDAQDGSRARQQRQAVPGKKIPPAHKNSGDIDRQLKKLVKDYGEYDLYSRRSPISLKTGVLGAFLLLAVLLSGFYFLLTPKAPDATPTSAETPPLNAVPAISAGVSKSAGTNIDKPIKAAPPGANLDTRENQELPVVNSGEIKNIEKAGPP